MFPFGFYLQRCITPVGKIFAGKYFVGKKLNLLIPLPSQPCARYGFTSYMHFLLGLSKEVKQKKGLYN